MRYITTAFLLIWSTTALATGKPNDTTRTSSSAVSSSVSGPSRSSAHNISKNKNVNTASANVGDTTATGGAASSISKSGDSEANVNVEGDNIPRQAPGIGLHQQQSTAVAMKCLGLMMSQARSDDAWGGGLGVCWKQRDDWAAARADFMASGGEYEMAAKEYCSKGMHRAQFLGDTKLERRDNCRTTVAAMYQRRDNPGMSQEEYELFIQAQAASYERDIEQLKAMLDEATGLKK